MDIYSTSDRDDDTKSTNDLIQEMIKVCDNSSDNHLNEETIVKSIMPEHRNDDKTAYQSPTLIIQQEVNELALQKEANKIKQKLNEYCVDLLTIENNYSGNKLTTQKTQSNMKNGLMRIRQFCPVSLE